MYRNDDPPTDEANEALAALADGVHDLLKTHLTAMTEDQQMAIEEIVTKFAADQYSEGYNDGMADASMYRVD